MAEQHLIVVHVGPVQDFIAAARRSRDLWFGSWLLSELSRAAARSVVEQCGRDPACLVFPTPDSLDELDSDDFIVPNRILALISGSPADVARQAREAATSRLAAVAVSAFDQVRGPFDRAAAARQVADLLEFFWAACPVDGDYRRARATAEALLAARKTTRDFAAVTWGAPHPKSSLDGQRESVIPEAAYDRVQRGVMSANRLRKEYGVRPGERLCGVGLLKRHGNRGEGDRFLSTSHVAALPLLERLTDQTATDRFLERLDRLGISRKEMGNVPVPHSVFGRCDGHLLFEERLGEYVEEEGDLLEAKKALLEFRNTALGGKAPLPYYALLLADGDGMGKAIGRQATAEQHRELSRCLTAFAGRVAVIVKEQKGSLVYSGGDDVLAFVPLHKAIACARSLALAFREALKAFKIAGGDGETSPTLSAGMVIAHHQEPLSDVLALARAAERSAKAVPGKDALAVTLSKRSGVDRTVAGHWGALDVRLERFAELHWADAIPDGAAYELQNLALRLAASDPQAPPVLKQALWLEAMRILRRKEARHGLRPIADEDLKALEALITQQGLSVASLAEELIIAREFAAARKQAELPTWPEEV